MPDARIQVQHTRDVLAVFHPEIEHVVEPILAQAVPVLYRDGDCIFLSAEQTIQLKLDFDFLTRFEVPEFGAFQARVGSENIHADAIADENSDHRVGHRLLKCGADTQNDGFSGPESGAGFAAGTEYLHVRDAAGTIAMARSQSQDSNGSQFFVVYKTTELPATYTPFGTIVSGLDIVQNVAKAGSDNSNGAGDGHPKEKVEINSMTIKKT